jgi:uncharacterized protein (TIGR03790 family)
MKYLCLLCLLGSLSAWADGNEVVVLYNSQMPASKLVAEHYAAARQVPAKQLFGFSLTTNEIITRSEFADVLQKPLAAKLEKAGLWKFGSVELPASGKQPARTEIRVIASKIRYAALCYGMPVKIANSTEVADAEGTSHGSEITRNEAAVDSELTWLPLIKNKVPLSGPMANPLYGCTNRAAFSPTNGILLVTRLDGPDADIANHLVDKALAAENNGFFGRTYFDLRGLALRSAYYQGDAWLQAGAEMCQELGFDLEEDTNSATFPASYPMSHIAFYAGWYDSDVSGPFTTSLVNFMPGAFAYHLHSFSAETLRTGGFRWCGPLLAKGATCTIGYVYEPYLAFTLNIPIFLRSWADGFTFGEAAWAAHQALSWQTTVIGDPLYTPFKLSRVQIHAQLARTHNPLIDWSFEQMVNRDRLHGMPLPQLEKFVENLPATAQSAVLNEKLAELYDAGGNASSAIAHWQQALKLNASAGQRIRIRRTLTSRLVAAGQLADAIDNDQKLLAEFSQYPGRSQVEEELKNLELEASATTKK